MGGNISLQSVHNTYVRANPGGAGSKVDMSGHRQEWETFALTTQPGGKVSFKSAHGTYLRANPGGEGSLVDLQVDPPQDWERWTLEKAGDIYHIKSAHGTYLRANPGDGGKVDLAVTPKEWESFKIIGAGGSPASGPVKCIWLDWNNPANTFRSIVDAGYNLIVLSFFVGGTPRDAAAAWNQLSSQAQQDTVNYAHSKGAKIIVSAGGATETPYNSTSGNAYGAAVANWAKSHHLDGVDFDLENFGSGFTAGSHNTADSITWVVDATNSARGVLGAGATITHAPQSPYFGSNGFADAYTQIHNRCQHINYLLIQYYNNGPANSFDNIFLHNNGAAVNEIASFRRGVPINKLVLGKPVQSNDASQGFVAATALRDMVNQAKNRIIRKSGNRKEKKFDITYKLTGKQE